MSIDKYIENLRLVDTTYNTDMYEFFGPTRSLGSGSDKTTQPIPKDLQSAVNVGSLLSFVEGVSPQEKDDVLYSVQIAHRGASGAYDRFERAESWYRKYIEILENLGWACEQMAFTYYDQSGGELRLDRAALAIITAIATQNQLAVLMQAVSALEAMAEEDGAIRLFDFHTSSEMNGNFQIGAVQRGQNGALSLAIGAFYFKGLDTRRRYLFLSCGGQNMSLWTAAQKMTLNSDFYAQHREIVRRKLADSANDFIAGLDIV